MAALLGVVWALASSGSVLAEAVERPAQPVPFAEFVSPVCPAEWERYAGVAGQRLMFLESLEIPINWNGEMAEAVGRFVALNEIMAGHTGSLLAWMNVSGSDETWIIAEAEHDLDYNWQYAATQSDLLHCMLDAHEIDEDLIMRALQLAYPEVDLDAVRGELDLQIRGLQSYTCTGLREASHRIFQLDFAQPGLPAEVRRIFEETLVDCED